MEKILFPDILKEVPEIEKAWKIINTITLTPEEREIYEERLKLLRSWDGGKDNEKI